MTIRPATLSDLEAIGRVQSLCPEASHWPPAEYLAYQCLVAETPEGLLGFVVAREVAPLEHEILNLAVVPQARRKGIARRLLAALEAPPNGMVFLEVRASNSGAQKFYQRLGFQKVGERPNYYEGPLESAIVMRKFS